MAKGDLGNLIKKERQKKFNKASTFAKILGISSAHVSDIEKGNRLPSKQLMKKIIETIQSEDVKDENFYDFLAKESNESRKIPIDVQEYMIENCNLQKLIRIAKQKNVSDTFWIKVEKELKNKGEGI